MATDLGPIRATRRKKTYNHYKSDLLKILGEETTTTTTVTMFNTFDSLCLTLCFCKKGMPEHQCGWV